MDDNTEIIREAKRRTKKSNKRIEERKKPRNKDIQTKKRVCLRRLRKNNP